MEKSNTKQTIVIRKDLKIRRGKEIAQGSHASTSFLVKRIIENPDKKASELLTEEEREWILGNHAKICLQVDSEHELMELYHKAKVAGLTVHLITDLGLTEFNGTPTVTALALGPHQSEKIDFLTSHLKLY